MLSWATQRGIFGAKTLEAFQSMHDSAGASKKPYRHHGGHRGGLASKLPLRTGATVLSVPGSLLIWSQGKGTEAAFRTAGLPANVFPAVSPSSPRLNRSESRLLLAAGLLAFKDNSAVFAGYLSNLPTAGDYSFYHPSAGRDKLLDTFHQLPVTDVIAWQRRERRARWEEFVRRGGRASFTAWEWAELTVMTRNWEGPGGWGHLLAPVADAIRPRGPGEQSNVRVEPGNPDTGRPFRVVATRDVPAGEELLLDYGRIPDDQFLAVWGFTPGRFAPERLDDAACSQLALIDGVEFGEANMTCSVPAGELQKDAFCSLALLASEQCGFGRIAKPPIAMEDWPFYRHPIGKSLLIMFVAMVAARQLYLNRSSGKMARLMTKREGLGAHVTAGVIGGDAATGHGIFGKRGVPDLSDLRR
jgi:hypothetical protein